MMVWGDDGDAVGSTTANERKNGEKSMSKGKNIKKKGKNKPAKTVKEKKQAKREKKNKKDNPGIFDS